MASHIGVSCDFCSEPNFNVRDDDVEQRQHVFAVVEQGFKLESIYLLLPLTRNHRQTFVYLAIWLIFDQVKPK